MIRVIEFNAKIDDMADMAIWRHQTTDTQEIFITKFTYNCSVL